MGQTHKNFVDSLKTTAIKQGTELLVKALVKRFAFLSFGPFVFLLSFFITKLLEILIRETEYGIYFEYTDFTVDTQAIEYRNAIQKNSKIQMEGTDEEKKLAEKELFDAFKRFVKLSSI